MCGLCDKNHNSDFSNCDQKQKPVDHAHETNITAFLENRITVTTVLL
jgi:hypothetical protein